MEAMIIMIRSQKTEELIDMAKKLAFDVRDEAGLVLDKVLDELMIRMPENEFIKLCDNL